jgi:hypothetical protein
MSEPTNVDVAATALLTYLAQPRRCSIGAGTDDACKRPPAIRFRGHDMSGDFWVGRCAEHDEGLDPEIFAIEPLEQA